jgi:hypothetical protein
MKKIYKYPINATDIQSLQMPEGATILTAAMQGKQLCLWAIVNPEAKMVFRTIEIFGTGHTMSDEERKYISTFQLDGGLLIFHVFEKGQHE